MRKLVLFFCFITCGLFIILIANSIKQKIRSDLHSPLDVSSSASPTVVPTVDIRKNPTEKKSLFIPYWTLHSGNIDAEDYSTAIYFGIIPTETGINTMDDGYLSLTRFLEKTKSWENRYLTLRMLDNKLNFTILEDERKQDRVISEFLTVAKENGFNGVILDLEISALPFDSLISQVNIFTKKISEASHTKKLSFGVMIYGDTFYRVRPFEVKTIGKNADQLYIMAYDFSKARGNPGPNFPLAGKDEYGYDYSSLVSDLIQVVPPSKLSVVFGMYGYDWSVDDKKVATAQGESLSTNKIEKTIISSCVYTSCLWERDILSGEVKATYVDSKENKHIIWYEDGESVNRKKEYLKQRGINSYSFWAYSYF